MTEPGLLDAMKKMDYSGFIKIAKELPSELNTYGIDSFKILLTHHIAEPGFNEIMGFLSKELELKKKPALLPDADKLHPETLRYLLSIELYDGGDLSYMFGKILLGGNGSDALTEEAKHNIELLVDHGLKFPEEEIKSFHGFCCRVWGADCSDLGEVLSAARKNYNVIKNNFHETRNNIVYKALYPYLHERGLIKIITDLINI